MNNEQNQHKPQGDETVQGGGGDDVRPVTRMVEMLGTMARLA